MKRFQLVVSIVISIFVTSCGGDGGGGGIGGDGGSGGNGIKIDVHTNPTGGYATGQATRPFFVQNPYNFPLLAFVNGQQVGYLPPGWRQTVQMIPGTTIMFTDTYRRPVGSQTYY